ncbi:MAG: hypothetical protein M3Y13_03885 [Armatimonadota bacterium]|nr:hypothetical protein [Armatimonadota bacterium]
MIKILKTLLELLGKGNTKKRAVPVSTSLDVQAGPYSEALTNALIAIDIVHKDGQLPKIPIKRLALSRGMHGRFLYVTGGESKEIAIHYASSHAELTAVHEIGHFLDYAGFGIAGEFSSAAEELLEDWRSVVRNSRAVQRLGYLWRLSSNTVHETQSDGDVVEYKIEKQYIEYLLQNEELWARSYAQFITAKSAHPKLQEQLSHLRDRPTRSLYYWEQWDDEDFLPIMAEIEAVFRQLSWIQ